MKAVKDALRDGFGVDPSRVVHTSYEPIQFDENGAVCGAKPDAWASTCIPSSASAASGCRRPSDFLSEFLARLECIEQRAQARRLSGRSRHRRRHRLPPRDRAPVEIPQARHLRARSKPGGDRRRDDVGAAPLQDRRRVQAVFARHSLALCAALAAVPDAERRVHGRQHASRRHLAVRPAAAGLCRACKAAQSTRPPRRTRSWPIT